MPKSYKGYKDYMAYWRANLQTEESRQKNIGRPKESMTHWLKAKTYSAICEDNNQHRDNGKYRGITLGLDTDYVLQLYDQNPYCAISNTNLEYNNGLLSVSLDRIDNNLPHIESNIQLVNRGVNMAKNKASDYFVRYFIKVLCGQAHCDFYRFHRTFVKGKLSNYKRRDKDHCDLTLEFIQELYHKQNGKCALSDIPLAMARFPCFDMSVDRIDNSKYHTQDNVRLVTTAMNLVRGNNSDAEVHEWIKIVKRANNVN